MPPVRRRSEPGSGDVPAVRKPRKRASLEQVRRFGPVTWTRTYGGDTCLQVRFPRRWHVDVRHRR